ncbi:UNVERIFIED_CONTAM: Cellulose synthase-like protein G3 [Sesamum angustifolium]|uniref:Cellulose synthase-like protein G3 n=1 Tax=Sesamum angustifolium TaxID=2727405 RepID=A0AAW2NZD3_9LAMI
MENSLPLNDWHVRKTHLVINRLHAFLHGTALLALFYYRLTSLTEIIENKDTALLLPHVLIFISELILSFIWLLSQPSKWKPIVRTVYPERLPGDEKLPSIDVFVCTADPRKEPCLEVMNTVISAMALDYPSDKLHVYLSDDGGSLKRYEEFKDSLQEIVAKTTTSVSRDHPPAIEVISQANGDRTDTDKEERMPLLVYVAREKRPSQPHNFKAGALNVLLRVSAMISNSPYILVLDCDMYCNDPSSARQAMCLHLDPKFSANLGFVQFPQKFYNISETDIYDGQLRYIWVGFRYFAVVEDYFTGFNLHCEGWISMYLQPSRSAFLGASPMSLNELLVQNTRWYVGLNQVAMSRFQSILRCLFVCFPVSPTQTCPRDLFDWALNEDLVERAKDMDDEIIDILLICYIGSCIGENWIDESQLFANE